MLHTKSFNEVMQGFREMEFEEKFDLIVAIANGGIIPAAIINQKLGVEFQVLKINLRNSHQQQIYDIPKLISPIDFDYKGKVILLVEDRVKTGATLNFAKSLLHQAKLIRTFAVNGTADYSLYNEHCFKFPWTI